MIAPYGTFELADGRTVLIAIQAQHEWVAFATDVLRRPELAIDPRFATNPDRTRNVDPLESEIRAVFGSVAADEVVRRLTSARIAHSWVRDPLSVWEHEQLAARDRYVDVDTPTGSARTFRPPFNLSDAPEATPTVPSVGEHDPAVIEQLLARAQQRRSG